MTKQEKNKFLKDLSKNIVDKMIEDLDRVPEGWGGLELRLWLVERFGEGCLAHDVLDKKRKREFKNDCLVNNL